MEESTETFLRHLAPLDEATRKQIVRAAGWEMTETGGSGGWPVDEPATAFDILPKLMVLHPPTANAVTIRWKNFFLNPFAALGAILVGVANPVANALAGAGAILAAVGAFTRHQGTLGPDHAQVLVALAMLGQAGNARPATEDVRRTIEERSGPGRPFEPMSLDRVSEALGGLARIGVVERSPSRASEGVQRWERVEKVVLLSSRA